MKRKIRIKTQFDPLFKYPNLYVDKVLEKVKRVMLKELAETNLIGREGLTFEIDVVTALGDKTEGSSISGVIIDEFADGQLDRLFKI